MKEEMRQLNDANSVQELFDRWTALAQSYGAISSSYHFTPALHSQLDERSVVILNGYSDAWSRLYDDPIFRKHDPVPDYVMRTGRATSWKAAIKNQKLTPEQVNFVAVMREHGLKDGIGIPLFGPNGREAYASMSIGRTITDADSDLIHDMVALGQVAHRRATMLIARDFATRVDLTKRETEVLQWMARGKSNTEIGAVLEISPSTVDSFARKIFAKLGVNDRISATLEGIARGLVRP
jgi:DNA-binding CsgD family transcriptional regulator